ncbi:hypothetical protein CWR48_16355 [Oceanobacillus arenosus]|uniref:Uncharacterized protein n=1 Tax=Oceanobacillus arenosus TaxID=1229153 RepID=A0A3D8PMT2_9BACI|nr:hypothetical protein [Oceanobacillus arenosus]RDW16455.1 hypothetical protein CWR48_16355 [Oceanobacillus arenosus]
MIKKGHYGIYNGTEYILTRAMDGNLYIGTRDLSKVRDGFIDKHGTGAYKKRIKLEELTDYYTIEPIAEYKGHQFDISPRERNGKVSLGTGNNSLAKKYDFKMIDKYYYEKWVPKEEVTIIEKRRDIKL